MSEYELYHHGILGMKWGIRRFQNKDGSLTTAGKQRYRTDEDLNDKGETRKSVQDSLFRKADRNSKLSETYYNKSELKKDKDDYYNSPDKQFIWGNLQKDDKTGGYKYDADKGYETRLKFRKEHGFYDEEKDTNLQRSKEYENKANEYRSDARKLSVNYQRNKAIADGIVSAIGSAFVTAYFSNGDLKSRGKKAALAALGGGLAGASYGSLTGWYGREQAEKKYGFKK